MGLQPELVHQGGQLLGRAGVHLGLFHRQSFDGSPVFWKRREDLEWTTHVSPLRAFPPYAVHLPPPVLSTINHLDPSFSPSTISSLMLDGTQAFATLSSASAIIFSASSSTALSPSSSASLTTSSR